MLGLNEAVIYNNVDNEPGTLRPVKSKVASAITTERFAYFYESGNQWFSSAAKRDYLEFQNALYYTDRVSGLFYHRNGLTSNASITKPTAAPVLASTTAPAAPTAATALVETSGSADIPAQEHSYMFVNVGAEYYSEGLIIVVDLETGEARTPSDFDFDTSTAIAEDAYANVTNGYNGLAIVYSFETGRKVTFSKVTGATYGPGGINVYRLYEGEWRLVGNLANASATLVDDTYDISANDALDSSKVGPLKGVYQYVYTFYNATRGVESGPSPVSSESADTFGRITVSSLGASPDPQVTHKRLYRVGGNLAEFTRVVELPVATTSYADSIKDSEVEGTILPTEIYDPAPAGLKYIAESYAMLFGAVGTNLRFTPVGAPDAWPEEYAILFDATITGIAPVANGVLVFTKYKTHLVTGTGPLSLSSQLLSSDQGCVSHDSVQVKAGAAIWASTDGLCTSAGDYVAVITKDKLGKLTLDPVDSILFDEVYYCLESSGSILAFDTRYGSIFKRLTLGVSALTKGLDTLYGWANGVQHKLFASDSFESMSWKSPRFIEGRATENKTYKKVYIYSKGLIIINVYINDVLVCTKQLDSEDGHVIQVPQVFQRGFFIQFEITGTGEVYELEYEATRRNE